MGFRFTAIGMLVLAGAVWTVWPSPDASDAPVVVAQLRDAHVPAIVRQVRAAAVELELDADADPELEVGEPSEQLDEDGLTDNERWESQVAELEDRLRSSSRGAIHGVVQYGKSTERLAGVTVIATRLDSPWGYTAITDEHGYYAFPELPPGNYVVTFDHLDGTTSQLAEVDSRAATPVFETVWKPLVPIVIEPLSSTVSFTGTTSVQNSFVVDSIDVSGLTFGDDE